MLSVAGNGRKPIESGLRKRSKSVKLVKVSQSQAPPCFSLMGFSFAKHLILLFLAKDTYTPSRSFMICLWEILLNAIFRITFAIFFVKG